MNIKAIGIDLAKNVFQLHGVDAKGKRILSKRLKRAEFKKFMEELSPCIVGIEACGGAHYWARILMRAGHTVRMMAPQFVRPYRKSNKKNDANDAEAIAEALMRPNMRFVPLKSMEQQDLQSVLTATAAVASIGDGQAFKRGREVSAWLGLVPRQCSSGNKTILLGIGKRSDSYLRTLLIHGGRSVVRMCDRKMDGRSLWIRKKKAECGANKAAVALANKNARIIWALLTKEEKYRSGLGLLAV